MTETGATKIDPWLETLWEQGGSDLLLLAGSVPRIRVSGKLRPIEGSDVVTADEITAIATSLLSAEQATTFKSQLDVDFSFSWSGRARIRGSVYTQQGNTALALRLIPGQIPSFEDLGLPNVAQWIAEQTGGFVLVTGPTGSGKSTTLASIVDRINETRAAHILTIEDPVEFIHHHKQSAVSQREIGMDSPSFERALRSALREDPDVLLIGEMRDNESISVALTMAETGHLVFGTLHTNDAPQAIDRIIDVFPANRQEQVRVQLAASLSAIIAQRLVPRIGGGMVAAFEVLVATHPVRNLIREGRANQLANVMFTGSKDGMQSLDGSLAKLVAENVVEYDDALSVSSSPKEFNRSLEQLGFKIPTA